MGETLNELGRLLLGSVPTIIVLLCLYGLYTVIVHRPLQQVLMKRRALTEGAIEKSHADIAAAEARTAEYEHRLREARAAVFRAQEARREAALETRANAVNEARKQAQAQVAAARKDIESDQVAAQRTLQAEAESLAQEIIKRVLQPAMGR
jgi:F-type H+-transporting ATPase subunit b